MQHDREGSDVDLVDFELAFLFTIVVAYGKVAEIVAL
jgi:hypothetical protein